jgi:hypothetical protein
VLQPSNSAIFGDIANFCLGGYFLSPPAWRFFGDIANFCLGGDFLSPPTWQCFGDIAIFLLGFFLSPPTRQFFAIPQIFASWGVYCSLQLGIFLEIFRSFVSGVIFCALRFSDFWQFSEVFVSRVIICALQFCGVSCVLEESPVFWILDCRENCWAYRLVVCCGVMLCKVICQVLCAMSPVITELSLFIAAPWPVEMHIHGLECFG